MHSLKTRPPPASPAIKERRSDINILKSIELNGHPCSILEFDW